MLDNVTFLWRLQQSGLTTTWTPGRQGTYIKGTLKGGENYPSINFDITSPTNYIKFTNIGPSYVGLHRPTEDVGHAIAIHGREKAILDPNIGYVKATGILQYQAILTAIFASFYVKPYQLFQWGWEKACYTKASIVEFG